MARRFGRRLRPMSHHRAVFLAALLAASIPASCVSTRHTPGPDPLADLRNRELPSADRADAVGRAWEQAAANPSEQAAVRAACKDLAWQPTTPVEVRRRIMDLLIADPDESAAAQARAMVRLMLPKEQSRAMMAYLCEVVASRTWSECAPNLVRSYSRIVPEVPDAERAEAVALRALFPDRDAASVVFEVFLNPPTDGAPASPAGAPAIDWTERARADAWDLLSRLDTDGTRRMALIEGSGDTLDSNPIVAELRRCRRDLHCVPLTGDELRWLRSLSSPDDKSRAWWEEARAALALLGPVQSQRLTLRHAEAVRWAAARQPAWLSASREELLSELAKRLDGRQHRQRGWEKSELRAPLPESLSDWRDRLRWGDLLTALVIDEATHQQPVLAALARQAELDRRDTTTEFGGLVEWIDPPGTFRATLFPPRPGQREGDERFVASDDLIASADHSLAQYHFHVQRPRNESYAGPSRADILYAARSGRNCVVLTSVSPTTFNIDYYQPDGVVLDLGDVEVGPP